MATPRGGMARMSRRVMNLAHMLTQNARRHGDRIGFIWGEKSWTWREIDRAVSALAAGLAARGVVKGDRILVHSKNCDEMFWSMFAAFRLGAVWVPTNFRLMPDEVAYLATASGAPYAERSILFILPSSIDADCLTGDESGLLRGKKGNHRGDFVRTTKTADRYRLGAFGKAGFEVVTIFPPVGADRPRSANGTGTDGIDGDTEGARSKASGLVKPTIAAFEAA